VQERAIGGDMESRYKSLVFASVLLRVVAVIVVLVGVGFCIWGLWESERSGLSRIDAILGIGGSLIVGIVVYSFGEFISFVLDIWAEVRDKVKGKVN